MPPKNIMQVLSHFYPPKKWFSQTNNTRKKQAKSRQKEGQKREDKQKTVTAVITYTLQTNKQKKLREKKKEKNLAKKMRNKAFRIWGTMWRIFAFFFLSSLRGREGIKRKYKHIECPLTIIPCFGYWFKVTWFNHRIQIESISNQIELKVPVTKIELVCTLFELRLIRKVVQII